MNENRRYCIVGKYLCAVAGRIRPCVPTSTRKTDKSHWRVWYVVLHALYCCKVWSLKEHRDPSRTTYSSSTALTTIRRGFTSHIYEQSNTKYQQYIARPRSVSDVPRSFQTESTTRSIGRIDRGRFHVEKKTYRETRYLMKKNRRYTFPLENTTLRNRYRYTVK